MEPPRVLVGVSHTSRHVAATEPAAVMNGVGDVPVRFNATIGILKPQHEEPRFPTATTLRLSAALQETFVNARERRIVAPLVARHIEALDNERRELLNMFPMFRPRAEPTANHNTRRPQMSAKARRAVSRRMKKYWADKRADKRAK